MTGCHGQREQDSPLNKDAKDKSVQSTYSVKRPLGLKNTTNISCNKLSAKQNSKNTSTINKEPKAHEIPTFTRTYTIVKPKPSLNAASQKPPLTKVQSANTQATKAANHTTNASTTVKKTINGRMIHGPIVKTRTGLTPAVVQPRNLKSRIFTSANDAKTSTNKAQSSTTSHRLASQASNRSLKKTSALLKPAGQGTVEMMERERNKPQNKCPTASLTKHLQKKLQEWRELKGISYKRPPMFVKSQARRTIAVPQPFWSNMEQEDEAHSLISAVDRSLADCIKLLGEVKEVLSRLPEISQKFAKYWICQARLMERDGNLDVLPMFEKAVGLVLEVRFNQLFLLKITLRCVNEMNRLKKHFLFSPLMSCALLSEVTADASETSPETMNGPMNTPKPTRALICAEKGNSSVVKYKITATCPPSQRRESTAVNGQDVRFFTPVRRSVRIEKATLRYPVSLQDHDLCVTSYNDLLAEEEKETVKQGDYASTVTNTPLNC
uniref:Cytoskeleton-associated protein 2 C-terminal domain-containing protein n=1 Tax=Neogobius melanostomus TaxID=47308 RepID=A0A8C6WXH1_9GOBI